jgi:DNA-binding transcriptional MerR regulator
MAESMTITELADRVGMTPRNIRAYQSRGLLFAPEIRDRVARYSGAHAARLTLIASLQREGYTLAVIKGLFANPDSYSAVVADRRHRFHEGSSDIPDTVPIPEDRIRALLPHLPEDLTETGLAWRDETGQLVSHTVLVAVGRTLASHGVSFETLSEMQLGAARSGREMGTTLRRSLAGDGDRDADRAALDLSRLAMQLSAMAFELAFLAACTWDEEAVEAVEAQGL